MNIYALFTSEGLPQGFWADDIWEPQADGSRHSAIPTEAVKITGAQHFEFISNQGRRQWDGAAVVPYTPPPVEPPFPSVVSASQAKIALLNAGLLDEVEAIVAAHPYRIVRIWYADANQWERGNPYVQALGVEMGLDDAAIDDLFIAASKV